MSSKIKINFLIVTIFFFSQIARSTSSWDSFSLNNTSGCHVVTEDTDADIIMLTTEQGAQYFSCPKGVPSSLEAHQISKNKKDYIQGQFSSGPFFPFQFNKATTVIFNFFSELLEFEYDENNDSSLNLDENIVE